MTWRARAQDNQALWMINEKAFPPDVNTQIDQRLISGEASYILGNIGARPVAAAGVHSSLRQP
jgi:hypothetical protein